MDLLEGDVELTEFEAIDVQSIKGVGQGANGFPILMMKGMAAPAADLPEAPAAEEADDSEPQAAEKAVLAAVAKAVTDGKIDQGPDVDLGHQIMALLAQAIQNEAQEIGAGSYGETCDVDLLNCAASMISRWTGREAAPGEDDTDAMMLMQSAAKAVDWTDEQWAEWVGELQKAIPGARLLPPGSAPLDSADDTAKSQIAPEETTVDTVTQETGGLTKAVEDAIAKATQPLQERIESLNAELAKVKAAPVPSGLVLSRNVQVKQPGAVVNEDYAAKAAYFREQAQIWDSQDRGTADGYRKLARDADAKAVTPTS